MIYTCTLNPSVDLFVSVKDFQLGSVNLSAGEVKVPGGKGINVSRVLQRLGLPSKALGFTGGFTGDFIQKKVEAEGIQTDFIRVSGDTRINIKLKADVETEINGTAPAINDHQLNQLLSKLAHLTRGDVLVLSGSVPCFVKQTIYREILEKVTGKGILTLVDTKGMPLKHSLEAKPFLIKPNHVELGDMFGTTIRSQEEALQYAGRAVKMGAENVIVSMAGQGAVFANKKTIFTATVPEGKVKNSVGAGDSVVAGFISSYINGKNPIEAFRYGIAAGSASAFSKGFCSREKIASLFNQVKINEQGGKQHEDF
jgi:1-phosphofructokinase